MKSQNVLSEDIFKMLYSMPYQNKSVDLAISATVMLNLFQHLKEIPKQARDDNRRETNTFIHDEYMS